VSDPSRTDLGMCPATLLPDPMQCDAAAFASCIEATADAGFEFVSLWPFHTAAIGLEAAAELLHSAGVSVRSVEAATKWSGADTDAIRDEALPLLDFARRFGADSLAACRMEEDPASLAQATEGFSTLCGMAEAEGVRVCLEFLPWTGIPDLRTAWQIVHDAGAANGGLLVDTWHWTRQPGGPDFDLLRQIPGDRIHFVQLSDTAPATAQAGLFAETMTDRRLPGTGTTDLRALFAALKEIDAHPMLAAEVFSSSLSATGPRAMATAVRAACDGVVGPADG
jgi:sugar phosphate isomerase/epimerase